MRSCRSCGHQVDEGARRCPSCGRKRPGRMIFSPTAIFFGLLILYVVAII